ncbi:MAG: sodium-dependent transporter [Oleiphilaceae bacterium]|nr:sodium-dependent transporter [Oleiphilaceae bacterium]
MDTPPQDPRAFWGSRWTFTLAAIGCALGLGNLWRWPVLFEQHGGSAFLLVYGLFLALLSVPLLMAEFMLGRQYRSDPVSGMDGACQQSRLSGQWLWLPRMALLAGFVLVSFYAVVGGMALAYVFLAALGEFNGASRDLVSGTFAVLQKDPRVLAAWQFGFLVLVLLVSARGIHHGLSRSLRVVVPLILALMLVLLVYGGVAGDAGAVISAFKSPDFAALGLEGVLQALAQAFYTAGLATGAMMMLGAYMPGSGSIRFSAWMLVAVDTLMALLAAVFVVALVDPLTESPEAGFGLLFQSLPLALSGTGLAGGVIAQPMTSLLFVLVVLLAWSSAILVFEPIVVWLLARTGLSRWLLVTAGLFLVWLAGLGTILSFNHWSGNTLMGHNLFAWLNLLATGLLMPLVAMGMALFLGWVRPAWLNRQGLVLGYPGFFLWQWLMRWLVPAAMGVLILFACWNFYGQNY